MKPEDIAKNRVQAIACAHAVHECRLLFFVVNSEAQNEKDENAYKLEQAFWRLADRYEREAKKR